ncbi:hypothetical protein [Paludisphaera rhizosphaerae]|uniref:hypothetical protein n=1 Tax=Paludisphaera rhizosphaerae TaxID=2711216 RepID=UPI0013EB150C|nr:hypothetical protein [Paludisphaera rhizosphaerae]
MGPITRWNAPRGIHPPIRWAIGDLAAGPHVNQNHPNAIIVVLFSHMLLVESVNPRTLNFLIDIFILLCQPMTLPHKIAETQN